MKKPDCRRGRLMLEREVITQVAFVVGLGAHKADHRDPLAAAEAVPLPDRADPDRVMGSTITALQSPVDQVQRRGRFLTYGSAQQPPDICREGTRGSFNRGGSVKAPEDLGQNSLYLACLGHDQAHAGGASQLLGHRHAALHPGLDTGRSTRSARRPPARRTPVQGRLPSRNYRQRESAPPRIPLRMAPYLFRLRAAPRPFGSSHVRLAEAAEDGDGLGEVEVGLSRLPRPKIIDLVVFDARICVRYVRPKLPRF